MLVINTVGVNVSFDNSSQDRSLRVTRGPQSEGGNYQINRGTKSKAGVQKGVLTDF